MIKKWYCLSMLFFLAISLHAQNSDKPKRVTNTYLIKNVNIIQKPGQMIDMGQVLIKDGLIKQVGKTISPPSDAEIISADSMYVYAGFIDALSHTGLKKEEEKERSRNSNPGNPTNEEAGIVPERLASSLISSSSKSIENMRKNGFAITHVVPKGNMLPGSGSVIVLNGNSSEEMVIKDDVSLFGQLKGSGRIYPSTIIGVLAKWKDIYRNAEIAKGHQSKYDLNPSGIGRPAYDDATKALFPVIDKKKSVFMHTKDHLSAHRAMKLKKDLGFDMVLCELKQGWHLIDQIKRNNIPVLLSYDIPEKKEEKKDEKKDDEGKEKKEEAKKEKEIDPELKIFKEKKEKSIDEYIGQAAAFEKAGIPFSFSHLSGKAKDLKKNIRQMIKSGLSENAALAALTTNPAKLIGVDNIAGTIDPGKMANLVITNKSYFDEKSKIRYVFVEGEMFEFEEKKKKKKKGDTEEAKFDITGQWSYKLEIPMPENEGTLDLKKEGEGYTVTLTSASDPDDPEVIENVVLDGDNMSFSFEVTEGMAMTISMDLTFTEESFEGTVTAGEFGTFPMNGEKISGPKK